MKKLQVLSLWSIQFKYVGKANNSGVYPVLPNTVYAASMTDAIEKVKEYFKQENIDSYEINGVNFAGGNAILM